MVASKLVSMDPETTPFGGGIIDTDDFRLQIVDPGALVSEVTKNHLGSNLAISGHRHATTDPTEAILVCINRDFAVANSDFKFPEDGWQPVGLVHS